MAKNFGSLPREDNQNAIPVGRALETSDITGTPQVSPLAYTTGEINLAIPTNAVEIVMRPSTDIRVAEAASSTPYYVVSAGTTHIFPVGGLDNIYFIRDSANGTLNFYFVTV
jgi:hypothetical protein|tara:strand:+ start:5583 stop:5918 length:336 start_codon:yes stop_codon:yes gene_type:complete